MTTRCPTTNATPAPRAAGGWHRHLAATGLLLAGLGLAPDALAHAGSTAFLRVGATPGQADARLRWDIALRDLDDALELDADRDGALTWGEVQDGRPDIDRLALAGLDVLGTRRDGPVAEPCPLVPQAPLQIVDHGGEPYAVLAFTARCPAPPAGLTLRYRAFFDRDASHRALVQVALGGQAGPGSGRGPDTGILAPERRELRFGAAAVRADAPTARNAFAQYFLEGLHHVWSGADHLLFLAGLFLAAALVRTPAGWRPVPRLRDAVGPAVKLVTAFTVAHAVTLCLAALGVISLPTRLVESAVAATVLFAGLNNLRPLAGRRTVLGLVWLFGLIHGTAIAGALLELGLPATGRVAALLGFNLGVEAAQLLLVGTLVPLAFALRRWRGYVPVVLWPGSAAVALAGLAWLVVRAFALDVKLPI